MVDEQEDEKEALEDSMEILCFSFTFLFKLPSCNHKLSRRYSINYSTKQSWRNDRQKLKAWKSVSFAVKKKVSNNSETEILYLN